MARLKLKQHDAENQCEAERWKCDTCDAPAMDDERYCYSCKSYWDDCADGLFDEPLAPIGGSIFAGGQHD